MGAITHIEWCDHTFNPWEGCTAVSTGCAHCYAESRNARWNGGKALNWGKGAPRRRTTESNWREPIKWNRLEGSKIVDHAEFVANRRPRVFCASLADWLDDEVPIEWLADLLDLIRRTPNLDWLLLTKRPQNWDKRVGAACSWMSPLGPYADTKRWLFCWLGGLERENHKPPANIWMGTSVENQKCADERIPKLLEIPAAIRFLSVEPLLGPIILDHALPGTYTADFSAKFGAAGIHWVIIGGESGRQARSCEIEQIRQIGQQCLAANVPVLVKQLGAHPIENGKRLLLTDSKGGGDMSDWPKDLRVRQFPQP